MKESLEFLGLILSLSIASGTILWQIAEAKADIYRKIDATNDIFRDEMAVLRNRLDIHLTQYAEHRGMSQYLFNALEEKLNHKFNRLYGNQKDLQAFLQAKSGFVPRESYNKLPDSQ